MNYFEILGVPSNADRDSLKKAFVKRIRNFHPDKNISEFETEEFARKLIEAYNFLKNPEFREKYVNELE